MNAKNIRIILVGSICLILFLLLAQSEATVSFANSTTLSSTIMSSDPSFVIFPEWKWYDGNNWPDGTVYISVAGKPDCSTSGESTESFFNGGFPESCELVPGDSVTFAQGDIEFTHIIQELTVTSEDVGNDTISGSGPDGWILYVWAYDYESSILVQTITDGNWTADFYPEEIDLVEGMCGRAMVADEQGNATAVEWCIPNPRFTVFPEWQWFDANDWPAGATVSISVADKCEFSQESPGNFFNGAFPEECNVTAGDEVTFSDGTTLRSHTIQNLIITEVDAVDDRVEGMADDGAMVTVWMHNTGETVEATASAEGTWLADFASIYDLVPDDCGRAQIYDDEGNGTAIDWCAPFTWINVFPDGNFVEVHRWRQGITVIASIYGKVGCTGTTVPIDPDWVPEFRNPMQIYFPEGCDIVAGDLVEVENGITYRAHTVQNLSVTAVDGTADTVSGTADPGADVLVWPHDYGELPLQPIVDSEGIWIADFSESFDLQDGMCGRSAIFDEAGNSTSADWCVPNPHIIASTTGDWFWTWGFNPGTLDLSIYESADEDAVLLWSGQAEADKTGFMSMETEELGQDLVPGNYLVVSDEIYTKTLVLEQITMEVFDTQNEIMAGTAPLGREVNAAAGPLEWQEHLLVQADPVNGSWLADFKSIDFDITEDMRGGSYAQIFDEDGDANEASVPPSLPSTFRDDFDSESLSPGWFWENGDSGQWSLGSYGEEPGFLQLTASQTTTPEGNLLLRQIQQGDFSIETHFYFTPDTDYQFAGLVIYQDMDNFLQLGRAFCDVEGACAGNGLYFDQLAGGEMAGNNFVTPLDELSETTVRLERRGEMIRAFYSVDGEISWYELGTHWISPDFLVRGVGLVASQNYYNPDPDISAYFDYFELNEGWNFLPEGYHDSPGGDVPSWECNGNGWAADPDHRAEHLNVDVVVDDQTMASLVAEEFRQDLLDAEVCTDGNCSFSTSLWEVMTIYEPHRVDIWAQDFDTGEWVLLSNSNKTVTCRTYDIYSFDPLTGITTQITNLRDADEYQPSWSPNGKQVAFIAWYGDGSDLNGIYITDLKTGVTVPLAGAENGGDAAWSPNGKWIAFNDSTDLYLVPSTGGDATLIIPDAASADWAPNGKRVVFQRPSDGSIRTQAVGENSDNEMIVAESGANPVWSPDGEWIAYENEGDIWKVQVNIQGRVLGEPIQVTSGALLDGQPTWSPDSQTIVYHSGFTGPDWDIWSVPAMGGMGTWLTGGIAFGDYDPSYAKDADVVGYASFTPDGQAPRIWISASTYDLPADTWLAEGEYSLQFLFEDGLAGESGVSAERTFTVSEDAPIYDGYAVIRPWQIIVWDGEACVDVDAINPEQATRFHIGWTRSGSYAEAENYNNYFTNWATWEGPSNGSSEPFTEHELIPYTNLDWMAYICTFTG